MAPTAERVKGKVPSMWIASRLLAVVPRESIWYLISITAKQINQLAQHLFLNHYLPYLVHRIQSPNQATTEIPTEV